MPSLYANVVSSNAVIQPNNNTSLYNPLGGNTIPVNGNINANNINVSNNVHVGGQISATGNIVTAGYFIGDGSQLSNIAGSYGNSNVAAFLPTYSGNLAGNNITLTGAAVATGNITTGGFYFGDGSQLTGITTDYSNANVAAFLPIYSGNISAGNIAVVNAITGANITASGQISATGDISTQGNLRTLGAQGNIVGANYVSGNFFVGDGSLLTNVTATSNYSNANVTSLLAAFGSNTISTTGNISSGYLFGNGSQLTGIAASYGNANVAAFLPTYTGNLAGGNLVIGNNASVGGNLSVVGTIFGTFAGNISGNLVVPGANTDVIFNNNGNAGASTNFQFDSATNTLELNGQANVTGNVTASYFLGNGSQLTGLPATYSNANVTSLLASFGSNTINTTGNITGGNIIGNGQFLTSLTGGNVTGTVANATFATSAGTATSATTADQANYANIANSVSGSNVTGSVAQANVANTANAVAGGNVTGQVANALVAGTVYTAAQPAITSVGNLTSLTVTGDSLLQGNLQVNGNVTYIASNTVVINDKFINVANNAATASAANGGGIGVGPAGAEYATWSFSDANTAWQSNIKIEAPAVTTTGNITANYFIGNGSLLTNINAGNIVGAYGNANVADFLANGFGSNTITTTGNIQTTTFKGTNFQATGSGGGALKNTSGTTQASWGGGGGDNFAIAVSTNINGANAQIDISPTGTGHVHIKPTGTGAVEIAPTNPGSVNNMIIGNVTPLAANFTTVGATGNITGANINGNGSGLSSITGANVTGTVASATQANTANVANSVSGGNVTGQVANALVAGTVYTNAQPNITSVGILTSLSVTGNITGGNLNTAGNVSGSYILGDGSQLTNLPVQPGTYGNANVNAHLAAFGSNVISTTGNVTSGNINTSFVNFGAGKGNVEATTLFLGDTTGAYQNMVRLVNNQNIGYLQVGSGNTSGLFRVSKWLSANTAMEIDTDTNRVGINKNSPTVELDVAGNIAATGNVTAGNLSVPNTVNIGTGAAPGTLILNDNSRARFYDNNNNNYVDIVYGGPSAVNHTLILPTTVGANGQVLAAANANSTSTELTWVTSTATAGGSNTQIQFNDGSVFAGNANMTFNKITGNVTLGNVVTNTNNMQTVGAIDYANATAAATTVPWRIVMGNAYNGVANSAVVNTTPGTLTSPMNSPRLLVADLVTVPNNGMRVNEAVFMNWVIPTANISNNSTRLVASRSEAMVGGSVNNYAITATSPFLLGAHTSQIYIGSGTNANLSAVGNVSVSGGAIGMFVGVNTQPGSNVVYSTGSLAQIVAADSAGVFGNVTNQIAYATQLVGTPANANITGTTTAVGYYHPPNATTGIYGSGITTGNIARMATTYHAFRNDDDLARTRLGTLERMHYLNANVTSSGGAVTIDKNNGQVQQIYLTEAITNATFTNFAVRQQKPNATFQNSADEVTLIFQQGATPYNITLPSGNTQIRYANGVSTVTGVANTTVMIDVVGVYNYNTSATNYLVTVNPAFS
jgi:hypothetical protein